MATLRPPLFHWLALPSRFHFGPAAAYETPELASMPGSGLRSTRPVATSRMRRSAASSAATAAAPVTNVAHGTTGSFGCSAGRAFRAARSARRCSGHAHALPCAAAARAAADCAFAKAPCSCCRLRIQLLPRTNALISVSSGRGFGAGAADPSGVMISFRPPRRCVSILAGFQSTVFPLRQHAYLCTTGLIKSWKVRILGSNP
jgi:nitrogenase molybdenum-iron protein alpha/beta subunit